MTGLLLLVVPVLPLAAGLLALVAPRAGPWVVTAAPAASLAALLAIGPDATLSATWFRVGPLALTVGLESTALTWATALLVCGVSAPILLYAVGYVEESRPRFFFAVGLFVGAMLGLVLAGSFLVLFAGWELVGLASWMLIGFHRTEATAVRAAHKAFLVTRFADLGLFAGWLLVVVWFGTTDIGAFLVTVAPGPEATLIAALVLVGALGKSAQLPFSAWLPDAMAGPTPVSALIHSATMVAAGVFVLLRLEPLFAAAPAVREAIPWLGAATALAAGVVATAQDDLKRVLAWSTVAQLGEMMVAFGLGGPLAASFHLAAHAAFKSSLFLAAGGIERWAGTRDLRSLTGALRGAPVAGLAFLIGALALAGVFPLSGYWSEEAILAAAIARDPAWAAVMALIAFLGGLYIGRASRILAGPSRWPSRPLSWTMTAGLAVLTLAAAGLGWILHGRMDALLPFTAHPAPTPVWSVGLTAAGVIGLAAGWAGLSAGPVGRGSADVLARVTEATVPLAVALARAAEAVEQALNRLARHGVAVVTAAAQASDRTEHAAFERAALAVVTGAERLARRSDWAEHHVFDHAGVGVASATLRLARGSDRVETEGFGHGGNRAAGGLVTGGLALRRLQSGHLYHYTLALFAWTLLAVVIGGAAALWR